MPEAAPGRRRRLAGVLLLAALAAGCKEPTYQHRIVLQVVPGHPQLGAPPYPVAVWDRTLGTEKDYAQQWMGTTDPERPYALQLAGKGGRGGRIGLAIAIPRLNEGGYYWLEAEPDADRETIAHADFVPWGTAEPDARFARLEVQCRAEKAVKGWRLRLTVVP